MNSPIIFHRCCHTSVNHVVELSSSIFQVQKHQFSSKSSAVEKPNMIQKKTSNVAKRKELDEQMYLKNVNPNDFNILVNTFRHVNKKKISLYENLRTYRSHYLEKKIVGDPAVASEIVSCILENSEGDQNTPFIGKKYALKNRTSSGQTIQNMEMMSEFSGSSPHSSSPKLRFFYYSQILDCQPRNLINSKLYHR